VDSWMWWTTLLSLSFHAHVSDSFHMFIWCYDTYYGMTDTLLSATCSTYVINLNIIIIRGNYLFPPWTTKKCAMPPWTTNSIKIEHSTTKDNYFPPFRQSHAVLPSFSSSFPPMNYHHLPLFPPWTTIILQHTPI
jgi:hypothetical protein